MYFNESLFRRPTRPQSLKEGGCNMELCFILKGLWLTVLSGVEPEENTSWHPSELIIIPGDNLIVKGSNLKCSLKHFRPHSTFSS